MLNASGLEAQLTAETQFMLHHCKFSQFSTAMVQVANVTVLHYRSKILCTVTLETGWLPYALKDVGLFHSTLYHWILLNGNVVPESFRRADQLLRVKGTAIRLINEQLRAQSVTDEVIASVACLTSVNVMILRMKEESLLIL
jgi:hypothetical protein